MKHIFISLGSACDAALMMQFLGIRYKSYPFDWLWNFEGGLTAVTEIIKSDFSEITAKNSYLENQHYRFSELVTVYKAYPTIVHLHSDPLQNEEDHNTLLHRIERFKGALEDASFKHFIYYRSLEEDIINGKSKDLNDSFHRLIDEGIFFLEMIKKKYPQLSGKIHLLLVLQIKKSDIKILKPMIRAVVINQDLKKYISAEFV